MRVTRFDLSGIRRMQILGRAYRYVQRGPGGVVIVEDEEAMEQTRFTDLDLYEHLSRGEFKALPAKPPGPEDADREFRAQLLDLLRHDPVLNHEVRWRFKFVQAHMATGETRITRPLLAKVIEAVMTAEREALDRRNAEKQAGEPQEALLTAPAPGTLQDWIRSYRAAGWDIVGLIPRYARRGNRRSEYDSDVVKDVEAAFDETFLQMNGGSIVATYKTAVANVAAREGITEKEAEKRLPSIRFFYRFRDKRYDRYTIDLCREGKEIAEERWRPFGSGPIYDRANGFWQIDSTELTNWLVIWGPNNLVIGHAYVTVVYDCHSRCPVGFYIGFEPGGFLPIIKAIRHALLPKDLSRFPSVKNPWPCFGNCTGRITVDNDRGYISEHYLEALSLLYKDAKYAPFRSGWYKGLIERFFGTLVGQFRSVPGAHFLDYYKRIGHKPPGRASLVTMEQLEEHLTKWICDHYLLEQHKGLAGRRPVHVWQESVETYGIVPPPDDELLEAALSITEFRVPSKGGIEYEGLRYNSAELANIRIAPGASNSVRIKIDPENLGSIQVRDPENNRFVTVPVVSSQRPFANGVPLRVHRLARAMARANRERYDGVDGQAQALVDIMRSTRENIGKGTQKQRRAHARHLFRDTAQALDPDTVPPGDIVDPFADIELHPDAGIGAPPAAPTTATPVEGTPEASEPKPLFDDGFDFDAEARRLGIKPSNE